ncbi:hypothetical protein HAX54_005700, partial [Datura stramonium]|nr:hypothetical protein [Datura stramonium]
EDIEEIGLAPIINMKMEIGTYDGSKTHEQQNPAEIPITYKPALGADVSHLCGTNEQEPILTHVQNLNKLGSLIESEPVEARPRN